MRKNLDFHDGALFIFMLLFTWSCIDDEIIKENPQNENKNFTLQEAKVFFEESMEKSGITRSNEETSKSIYPQDFVPLWSEAEPSSMEYLECYDIPISTAFQYKAVYTEYKNGTGVAKVTNVYQKLIMVKDTKNNHIGQYILTLVPTKEYESKHSGRINDNFLNCMDKGLFTGTAIYTVVNSNMIARVNTYKDGVKVKGVFLLNTSTRAELEEKCELAISQLAGISFGRKKKIMTRSGEDDLWGGDGWDIDGGQFPDVIITPEPDINGGQFPDVIITPEPDPDPFPDPSTEPTNSNEEGSIGGGFSNNEEDTIEDVDPCQMEKNLNNNKELKYRVDSIFHENYYRPQAKEKGWINSNSIHKPSKQTNSSISYNWGEIKAGSVTEWFHSHPGGGPIPSFGDLKMLALKYKQGYIDVDNFCYGVISDFGCSCLVIVSEDAFRNFASNVAAMEQTFIQATHATDRTGITDKLSAYIDFLQRSNSGLNLLFNYYNEITREFEGWKAKTRDVNGQLENQSCK